MINVIMFNIERFGPDPRLNIRPNIVISKPDFTSINPRTGDHVEIKDCQIIGVRTLADNIFAYGYSGSEGVIVVRKSEIPDDVGIFENPVVIYRESVGIGRVCFAIRSNNRPTFIVSNGNRVDNDKYILHMKKKGERYIAHTTNSIIMYDTKFKIIKERQLPYRISGVPCISNTGDMVILTETGDIYFEKSKLDHTVIHDSRIMVVQTQHHLLFIDRIAGVAYLSQYPSNMSEYSPNNSSLLNFSGCVVSPFIVKIYEGDDCFVEICRDYSKVVRHISGDDFLPVRPRNRSKSAAKV